LPLSCCSPSVPAEFRPNASGRTELQIRCRHTQRAYTGAIVSTIAGGAAGGVSQQATPPLEQGLREEGAAERQEKPGHYTET
jgi:hypothetical protein